MEDTRSPHSDGKPEQDKTQLQPPSDAPRNGSSPKGANTGAMTTSTRRNANGSVSSVYSGNRIENLKKEDGQPLWRRDIQYQFLRTVFEDDRKVFTKASDGTSGHTFAQVYVDAMAKSSKCSQILKDKLLTDSAAAVNMAMICLLVNVGRMNTTLNFFPEMRARVRTYHAIPVLQANQSAQAYKQLQDGPRLKSILKGAMEDTEQPNTVDDIMRASKPRTNPVNLVFVLSQYAPKISEVHFAPSRDFFDLFIRSTLSSASRANAFLWMMWWYLESDFTEVDSQNNPYGKGSRANGDEMSVRVPPLELLGEEEAKLENVDTEEEKAFGEAKRKERDAILANTMPPAAAAPRRGQKTFMEQQHNYRVIASPHSTSASESGGASRGAKGPSRKPRIDPMTGHVIYSHLDDDRAQTLSTTRGNPLGEDGKYSSPREGSNSRRSFGRSSWQKRSKEPPLAPFEQVIMNQPYQSLRSGNENARTGYRSVPEESSRNNQGPGRTQSRRTREPRGLYLPLSGPLPDQSLVASGGGSSTTGMKRSRLPTAHQQAIQQSREDRVNYLLDRSMRAKQLQNRKERSRRGVIIDAWVKSRALPGGWDSEDDEARRIGGIDDIRADPMDITGDVGERASMFAKGWRRLGKSLDSINIKRVKRKHGRDEILRPSDDRVASFILAEGDSLTGESPAAGETIVKKRRPATRRRPAARSTSKREFPSRRRTQRKRPSRGGEQGIPIRIWSQEEKMGDQSRNSIHETNGVDDEADNVDGQGNSQDEDEQEVLESGEEDLERSEGGGDVTMVDVDV